MNQPLQLRAAGLPAFGCALLAALFGGVARADPPTPESRSAAASDPSPGTSQTDRRAMPEVTVKAQRAALERRLYGFVRGITGNERFYDESLPRWRAPLCFAVAGLTGKEGSFALDRLSQIARSVGVPIARRGCQYNFFVVFSADPDGFIKRAFRPHRRAFDQNNAMRALRRFLSPPKPAAVRVWHDASAVSRNGTPLSADSPCATVGIAGESIPVSCQYHPSRIEFYDVFEFSLALVVIDTSFPRR